MVSWLSFVVDYTFPKLATTPPVQHTLLTMWLCYSSWEKVRSMLLLIESGQAAIKALVTLCDLQAIIKVLALLRHSFLESSCHAVRKPKLSHEIPWQVHMSVFQPRAKLRSQLRDSVNCQSHEQRCLELIPAPLPSTPSTSVVFKSSQVQPQTSLPSPAWSPKLQNLWAQENACSPPVSLDGLLYNNRNTNRF